MICMAEIKLLDTCIVCGWKEGHHQACHYRCDQALERAEALLREARDLLWHKADHSPIDGEQNQCIGCVLEASIDTHFDGDVGQ